MIIHNLLGVAGLGAFSNETQFSATITFEHLLIQLLQMCNV